MLKFTTSQLNQNWGFIVTFGGNFSIDWGDTVIQNFVGTGAPQAINYVYGLPGTYDIEITFTNDLDLISISGFGNGLTGTVPSFALYTALEFIDIGINQLTGSLPSISSNVNLTEIRFDTNLLTGSIPNLDSNVALLIVWGYTNNLSGTIPDLSNNVAMTTFYVHENQLTGYSSSSIPLTLSDFRAHDNLLTANAIDNLVKDFTHGAAGRPAGGNLWLDGTNGFATLTTATILMTALPGWTIRLNLTAALVMRPDGVGYYSSGWYSNNGNPFWANLNEINQDADTGYVYTSDPKAFTVTFNDPVFGSYIQPTRITSAKLVLTVRVDAATPTRFKIRARHLGTDYDSEEYTIAATSYVEVIHDYDKCPDGTGWNHSNLSNMEFGLLYVDGVELRVTKMELQIDLELYTNQTLAVETINPAFQHWDVHPGTAGAHLSVGPFDGGRSYIYSDTLWSNLTSSVSDGLWGCYGFAANDVFAVGENGTILHWDGTSWTQQTSGTTESLLDVWGTATNDVFAVGTLGTILHYNGLVWAPLVSGVVDRLYGVWGSAPNDVWAVGEGGLALHYDGAAWTSVATPTVETLYSVWSASPTDVFACGAAGTVIYFDGFAWADMSTGSAQTLYDVWGTGVLDVLVCGNQGEVWRWTGAWTLESLPTTNNLRSIFGAAADDILVVGIDGITVRWDGVEWKSGLAKPLTDLHAVWGTIATGVFAVGESGEILHYDSGAWEPLAIFELQDYNPLAVPTEVDRVQISAMVKNVGDDVGHISLVARSAGNNYFGAHSTRGFAIPKDNKWHLIEDEFTNDPDVGWPCGVPGSTAWNTAEVDMLEVGIRNISGKLRCTTLLAETFQKHIPIATHELFPTADGYHDAVASSTPPQVPGDYWENIDEDPPDYGVTYLGVDATLGYPQYVTFEVGPATGAFPAGTQAYCVETRYTVALGTAFGAVMAPLIRYNNQTYIGRAFQIDGTGANWFDIKQDFYTSPFTSRPWTIDEIDNSEYGLVVLAGDILLNRLRVQLQTSPTLTGTPDATDLRLADAAFGLMGFVTRSTAEGIIYAVTEFAVGTGGFDPTDPTTVVPVNPADVALINEIYRGRIQSIVYDTSVTPWVVTYRCRIPREIVIDVVGELALFAEVIWSPIPAEIGTQFIFSIQHFPCQTRHKNSVHRYDVSIEYP